MIGLEAALASSVVDVVKLAYRFLSSRNSSDEELPDDVREQYQRAIKAGAKAFARHIDSKGELTESEVAMISEFFKAPEVADEFSKLLDPGQEFFDENELSKMLAEHLNRRKCKPLAEDEVFEAWRAFSRAFSFSSRSAPALREFLRASYEAGSFRAISNISDIMARLEREVDNISVQEDSLSASMSDYEDELKSYTKWAREFARN